MTLIKINDTEYDAIVKFIPMDTTWDNRIARLILPVEMTIDEAIELFHDDVQWSIIEIHYEYNPETEQEEEVRTEIDCSAYNVLGEIVQRNNRSISIKMGQTTDLEEAYELLYGGNE